MNTIEYDENLFKSFMNRINGVIELKTRITMSSDGEILVERMQNDKYEYDCNIKPVKRKAIELETVDDVDYLIIGPVKINQDGVPYSAGWRINMTKLKELCIAEDEW